MSASELNLKAVIGFGGKTPNSLETCTIRGETYLIYPLGSTVVIKNSATNSQAFLQGHSGNITCLTISPDKKYIASGERSASGPAAKAKIILWDLQKGIENGNTAYSEGEEIFTMQNHKGSVKTLAFSHDGKYLASVGGQDDNNVVVWDCETGVAESGSGSGNASTQCVAWFNDTIVTSTGEQRYCFVTAGLGGLATIRQFGNDSSTGKLQILKDQCKVVFGAAKRKWNAICVSPNNDKLALGSATGDIIVASISLREDRLVSTMDKVLGSRSKGKRKQHSQFSGGVTSLKCIPTPSCYAQCTGLNYVFLVGSGAKEGKFAMIAADEGEFDPMGQLQPSRFVTPPAGLMGGVSSIACEDGTARVWVGTNKGTIYHLELEVDRRNQYLFQPERHTTSHFTRVNHLCFPKDCSKLFVSASEDSIRVWNTEKQFELLRIQVPSYSCNVVELDNRGKLVFSGWNDGKVRGFLPCSGKLAFAITDAHQESCTAIAVCNQFGEDEYNGYMSGGILSAGKDGRVRFWDVKGYLDQLPLQCKMGGNVKEHKGAVTALRITSDDRFAVSAAIDGSCIVWNINTQASVGNYLSQKYSFMQSTEFKDIAYHPDESQLITCGTDRKIAYWDAEQEEGGGERMIRVIEGSEEGATGGALNCLHIDENVGEFFATGGEDKKVKLYNYDEGDCIGVGTGHSGSISALKISPCGTMIVSCGSEGAIMIWDLPQ